MLNYGPSDSLYMMLSAARSVHGGDLGNGKEFANRGIRVNTDHVVRGQRGGGDHERGSHGPA